MAVYNNISSTRYIKNRLAISRFMIRSGKRASGSSKVPVQLNIKMIFFLLDKENFFHPTHNLISLSSLFCLAIDTRTQHHRQLKRQPVYSLFKWFSMAKAESRHNKNELQTNEWVSVQYCLLSLSLIPSTSLLHDSSLSFSATRSSKLQHVRTLMSHKWRTFN